jgi:hypothetical protein
VNRRAWIPILIILAAALTLGILWSRRDSSASKVFQFRNGMQYRLAGVTHGTNHVMGSGLARFVDKLPDPVEASVRKALGRRVGTLQRRTTPETSICAWFEVVATNQIALPQPMTIYAMLADENGVFAGDREYVSTWFGTPAAPWIVAQFPAAPRRSRSLQCVFFEYMSGGNYHEVERVRFRNPLYGRFSEWQPEPLPAVKMAGDLEVRLEQFSTGHDNSTISKSAKDGKSVISYGIADPGDEVWAAFKLSFNSPRGTNEVWTLEGAELSDATGNRVKAKSRSSAGEGWFAIGPALWPDEKTWRLKLELERKSGFAPEELAIFTKVAVPAVNQTNILDLTNATGGIELVLKHFVRKPDITNSSWSSSDVSVIRIEHAKLPEGVSVDFVEARPDDDEKLKSAGSSWSDSHYEVPFKTFPTDASHLTITFSVQRTRAVEFLVEPKLVEPESEQ